MHRKLRLEMLESRRMLAGDIGHWERFEVTLTNPTWSDNPFDLDLMANFTHTSSGRTLTQLGFYAGSDTWKVYFMPDEIGSWTYSTNSSDADLNGEIGSFSVVASSLSGQLVADGNRWKLASGDHDLPVIWSAVDLWEFRAAQASLCSSSI